RGLRGAPESPGAGAADPGLPGGGPAGARRERPARRRVPRAGGRQHAAVRDGAGQGAQGSAGRHRGAARICEGALRSGAGGGRSHDGHGRKGREPVMRLRVHWASGILALVLVTAGVLFVTGRLQLHWRPAAPSGSDEHADGHGHGKEEKGEEEGRVVGDKALLDADAIKVAGIRTAPVEKGSVAVALQVTGEVELPDQRLANVTARLPGVVREVYR